MAHLARTAGLALVFWVGVIAMLLGASCGRLGQSASLSAPVASSLDSRGAAAFSLATAPSHARRLPAPPPGCRPLNARAMPHPSVVHGWVPDEVRTTTVVAG